MEQVRVTVSDERAMVIAVDANGESVPVEVVSECGCGEAMKKTDSALIELLHV